MRCMRFSPLLLLVALSLPAQDLKEFEKKVTEFTLPNGLHFILLERHEAPVVSFHTFVNAGSADDPAGQTGMARMIERVAFSGTEGIGTNNWAGEKKALDAVEDAWDRVEAEANKGPKADQGRLDMLRSQARMAMELSQRSNMAAEFGRTLDENGATGRSAIASFDSTSYSFALPSNRIELWFLMESQRLLHPAFRDFYKQRESVLEEYRKQYEANPQAMVIGELLAAAFKVHPYRNPPGGWAGDIQNLRRNAAKAFFDRYYTPGNITIAMVGDLNPAEAKKMAERYFAPMEARPPAPAVHAEEPPQDGPKTVVVEAAGQPLLAVGYKRPSEYDKDDPAFDVLQFLFAHGSAGLLNRELVQEKHLASQVQVGATFPSGRYPNLMVFLIIPAQGRSVEENQRGLDDFLARFKTLNVEERVLAGVKAQARAEFFRKLASNDAMANMLALHYAQFGDWRRLFTAFDDFDKVTAEGIQRLAAKYLVATGRTTAYTVPQGYSNLPPPASRTQSAERKTGGVQ
uniref:Peptidase M16 domain protein n=1 Tax=Solibacter usitatus (strain Ellin6076) TaxID=234267 RepID=Q01SM7_SOLUE